MSFLFGLFRFFTWGNIIVVGFFVLILCMSLIMTPSVPQVLVTVLIFALVLHQNLLSTKLQSAISDPEVHLSKTFPHIYTALSIFVLLYCFFATLGLIGSINMPSGEYMKMLKQGPMGNLNEQEQAEVMAGIRLAFYFIGIHIFAVCANGVLAFIFFKRWKKDQAAKAADDSILDINA